MRKTGLRLMFAPRFAGNWLMTAVVCFGSAFVGYRYKVTKDREAYAMRGRSNLFRHDHEMIKKSEPNRELWY